MRFVQFMSVVFVSVFLCGSIFADTKTITIGQAAKISVTADGTQPFTYQWYKNGGAIAGATAADYTTAAATAVTSAPDQYYATVTNAAGSVNSDIAYLTVQAATPVTPVATITTQPVALSVTAGGTATFTVVATGSGTLSYQWSFGGVAITGATSSVYSIASVTAANAGNYTVSVVNTVNSVASAATTSSAVALSVTPLAPTITVQPAPQSVTVGDSATFSVTATGSGALSYQWRKGATAVAIAGATASSYTISPVATGDMSTYSVAVTNTASGLSSLPTISTSVSLTVNAAPVAPTITTQPVAQTVVVGQPVSFSVAATGSGTLTYQWSKGGVAISGATAATYSIATPSSSDAGDYAVKVTNSVGSVTSSTAHLTVVAIVAPQPDGYASTATGGAAGTTVTATTAVDFKTYAESTTAYVINVNGSLSLGSTSVKVNSNKTIQGLDGSSTIIGCLELSGGVSNVIIRGLNISNSGTTIASGAYTDGGDGITIRNSSNIFITHCSFFDCADQQIEISNGADKVTVSWCDFGYTSSQTVHRMSMIAGVAGSESKSLRVTLHHNVWADLCDTSMPSGTYGYVHLFNNYFKSSGNASGSIASDNAQFLAEFNAYEKINSPLYKENINTALAAGRILSLGNSFTTCTGNIADTSADSVFTPTYTYDMVPASAVAALCASWAGNSNGANSSAVSGNGATISGPTDVVVTGTAFTLTSQPNGFVGTSYQWRLNNFAISGATAASYSVSSAQSSNAGIYTVVIGQSAGDFVVSAPLTIALGTSGGSTSSSSSSSGATAAASTGGGGGGGAPSFWYLALIGALALARARKKNS